MRIMTDTTPSPALLVIRSALVALAVIVATAAVRAAYTETVLYDDFEDLTPSGTPIDTPPHPWSASYSWLDSIMLSSDTHAYGGVMSARSSGASGNGAVGVFPGGAIVPGRAEIYFYDDMALTKNQYITIGDSSGWWGSAVVIRTDQVYPDGDTSTTHYVIFESLASQTSNSRPWWVSTIPRSLGWHKAEWVRDSVKTYLYLDGTLVSAVPNSDFPDFNQFDLGAWNWDSPAGNTEIWFDNAYARRGVSETSYRWFADARPEPVVGDALAPQNTIYSGAQPGTVYRLRIALSNNMNTTTFSNERVVLQVRGALESTWYNLDDPNSPLMYADGQAVHGATVTSTLLTGSGTMIRENYYDTAGSFPVMPNAVSSGDTAEFDFAVTPRAGVFDTSKVYDVRCVFVDASGAFLDEVLVYEPYAQISGNASGNTLYWTGAVSTDWTNPSNWSPAGPPASTEIAYIPDSAVRNPTVTTDVTIAGLLVEPTRAVDMTIDGNDLTVNGQSTIAGVINHTAISILTFDDVTFTSSGQYQDANAGGGVVFRGNATIDGIYLQKTDSDTVFSGTGLVLTSTTTGIVFGDLVVAAGDDVTLNVSAITVADDMDVAGTVTLNGDLGLGGYTPVPSLNTLTGSMTVTGVLTQNSGGNLTLGDGATGTLSVGGDCNVIASLAVASGAGLTVDGAITAGGDISVGASASVTVAGDTTLSGNLDIAGTYRSTGGASVFNMTGGGTTYLQVQGTGLLDAAHPFALTVGFRAQAGADFRLSGLANCTGEFVLQGSGSGYASPLDGYVKFSPSTLPNALGKYRLRAAPLNGEDVILSYCQFVGLDTSGYGIRINDDAAGTELMEYCLFQEPTTYGAGSTYIYFGGQIRNRRNHWDSGTNHVMNMMFYTGLNAPTSLIRRRLAVGSIYVNGWLDGSTLIPAEDYVGGDAWDDDNNDGDNTDPVETPIAWSAPDSIAPFIPLPVTITDIIWNRTAGGGLSGVTVRWASMVDHAGFRVDGLTFSGNRPVWTPLHNRLYRGFGNPNRPGEITIPLPDGTVSYDAVRLVEVSRTGKMERVAFIVLNPDAPVDVACLDDGLQSYRTTGAPPINTISKAIADLSGTGTGAGGSDVPGDATAGYLPPPSVARGAVMPESPIIDNVQFTGTGIKITNPPDGLVRIDGTVVANLDVQSDGRLFVNGEQWWVSRRGRRLSPVSFDADQDVALFWVEPVSGEEPFEEHGGPLWIGTFGPCDAPPLTMSPDEAATLRIPVSPVPATTYRVETRLADDVAYFQVPGAQEPVPVWYMDPAGAYLSAGAPGTFQLDVSATADGMTYPVLRIKFGAFTYDVDVNPDHMLRATVNGQDIGTASFDGADYFTVDFPLSDTVLQTGTNTVELEPLGNPVAGVTLDDIWIDEIALFYNSTADVPAGGLTTSVTLSSDGEVAFSMPSDSGWVIDITDPQQPRALALSVTGLGSGRWEVSVTLSAGYHRLAVMPSGSETVLAGGAGVTLNAMALPPEGCYLAVGPAAAESLIQPLLDKRKLENYLYPTFLDIESIADRFGYGVMSAGAIQRAVRMTRPDWLAIVGSSTHDAFNREQYTFPADQFEPVPCFFVWQQVNGQTPTDLPFSDLDGDGVPDIPIGRIPSQSASELTHYVDRLTSAYTSPDHPRVILLADDANLSRGLNFADRNAQIASEMGAPAETLLYDLDSQSATAIRAALASESDSVVSLFVYQGHAGYDRWTDLTGASDEFTAESVSANWAKPVSVISGTCWTGSYTWPDTCMAEALLGKAGSGADVVFAPVVFGDGSDQAAWVKTVSEQYVDASRPAAGSVWLNAVKTLSESSVPDSVESAQSLQLFGDPAVRMDVAAGGYRMPETAVSYSASSAACSLASVRNPSVPWFVILMAALLGLRFLPRRFSRQR